MYVTMSAQLYLYFVHHDSIFNECLLLVSYFHPFCTDGVSLNFAMPIYLAHFVLNVIGN